MAENASKPNYHYLITPKHIGFTLNKPGFIAPITQPQSELS
jgi:hypothetical protein